MREDPDESVLYSEIKLAFSNIFALFHQILSCCFLTNLFLYRGKFFRKNYISILTHFYLPLIASCFKTVRKVSGRLKILIGYLRYIFKTPLEKKTL